jgi:hypothetical protein
MQTFLSVIAVCEVLVFVGFIALRFKGATINPVIVVMPILLGIAAAFCLAKTNRPIAPCISFILPTSIFANCSFFVREFFRWQSREQKDMWNELP